DVCSSDLCFEVGHGEAAEGPAGFEEFHGASMALRTWCVYHLRRFRHRLLIGGRETKTEAEHAAPLVVVVERPAHQRGELTGDGEAHTHRVRLARSVVGPLVGLEDPLPIPAGDAGTVVHDVDDH